ncbi:contractile injection system tape measure protein [Hwangdonia seohaensis]|uniref:Contractile injection system tape measure protein n=1 Tax=Hwangdonia seohaensis TaxID=1240727 RepID=A0ABW3RFS8_9FLAO|nr:contractile injection system tape measure protein [Hwangdonia seohaensis]
MKEATHIINKVFLEVNTNSSKKAFALKDNLGVFLRHQLFPMIERYFETKNTVLSGSTLRFNKIEIEINQTDVENLNSLKNNIFNSFKEKIDSEIKNASNYTEDQNKLLILSKNKSKQDAFIYFLQTGEKPWWQINTSTLFDEVGIKSIISDEGFSARFIKALAHQKARQRLVNQFNDSILTLLLATPNSKKTTANRKIFSVLQSDKQLRHTFWMAIMKAYRYKDTSEVKIMVKQLTVFKTINLKQIEALENFASGLVNKPLNKKKEIEPSKEKDLFLKTNITEEKEANEQEKEVATTTEKSLYINNAGLLLMHPFLKQLFINAKLADSKGNLIDSKKEKAIHLLHYLSTKQEQQLESELVLEKFLCRYPINQTMQRFIALPQDLKLMAEEVLQSAVTHWKALKNTSPDGLRTGFLQREGKLIVENKNCKIIVERKAQDILLDKIPWNIHLIKLPWLEHLIFVEW